MRPIASDQVQSDLALTEVFATKAQIRLLRFLAIEAEGSVTAVDVADGIGMTRSGARKALARLSRSGLVHSTEVGTTIRYALRKEGPIAEEIVRLFHLEREALAPGGNGTPKANGNGNGNGKHHGHGGASGNGTSNENGAGSRGGGASAADQLPGPEALNTSTPEFHYALVSLLEEDLSLIRRARENVQSKLENREPGNGHDLWEWRKVLDTYPLPRLLHFLESDSPRARRLRKSSPFPDVMSESERERLGGLIERVH